jgi:putative sterol carrier protein
MSRYLSPEWVQSFNDAVSTLDLSEAITSAGAGSLTASRGSFAVAQVVTDAPVTDTREARATSGDTASGNVVRAVLRVDEGHISFELDPDDAIAADVTIVLDYADALAIARGELEPADALAAGRVRVRGELAVLVAGQAVLSAAAAAAGPALLTLTD